MSYSRELASTPRALPATPQRPTTHTPHAADSKPLPNPPSIMQPSQTLLDAKDLRSFEHARKRHLQPVDRRHARARKPRMKLGNSCGFIPQEFKPVGWSGTKWLDPITSDDMEIYPGLEDAQREVDRWEEYEPDTHVLPLELSLSDLIRPARQRKGMCQQRRIHSS